MIMGINLIMNDNKEPMLRVIKSDNDDRLQINDILLTSGFNINKANNMLKSLDTGIDIEFRNFIQYNDLVQRVNDIVYIRG